MRVMKDDLIVILVLVCTFGATIWLMVVKSTGKPNIMMVPKKLVLRHKNICVYTFTGNPVFISTCCIHFKI